MLVTIKAKLEVMLIENDSENLITVYYHWIGFQIITKVKKMR